MIQVSLVGYGTGGAFLGLAYFDLTYHLMIILVLAAKFTGVLGKVPREAMNGLNEPPIHPSARWDKTPAWKHK
jgi:hypothetical protein